MRHALPMLFALCGCAAVGDDYQRPAASLPSSWSETSSAPDLPVAALEEWWSAFDDPTLDRLIERARERNLDLAIAAARVREARAELGVSESARLPSVDAGAGYARTRQSLEARGGAPFFGERENDLWEVGFDARWELDVFGGARRSVEAAVANLGASEDALRATLTSLVAEVARSYVELRGLQRQLAVVSSRVELRQQLAEIVQVRARAGVASDLDASRADAQVASERAELPALEALIAQRIHALGVLLSDEPRALAGELGSGDAIPSADAALVLDQPLELLRRRPDIRAAERRCAAASARVAAAVAARYPRVSLGAGFGWIANDSGDLFESSSLAVSIFPSISLPIFDAGLRGAQVRAAGAREEAAVLEYRGVVLGAAKEVEDALAAIAGATRRRATLRTAVEAQARAADLARQLYTGGVVDFLIVLDAERELFALQDQLTRSEAETSVQFVALAKALGGGWDPSEESVVATMEPAR